MAVYLLHFSAPIGGTGSNGAQHYLGYVRGANVGPRFRLHASGQSDVKIVRAFHRAGSVPTLVRIWDQGGRDLERYLKKNGHFAKLCPLCRQDALRKEARAQWERRQSLQKSSKQHSPKPTPASGGDWSPGSPTGSTGLFRPAPLPARATGSNGGGRDTADERGGTPSGAPVPTSTPADASAGTKQPSYSGGGS